MSDDENTTEETATEAEQPEETPGGDTNGTAALAARIAELEAGLSDREQMLARLNGTLEQRDARIAELEAAVSVMERTAGEREQQAEGVRAQLSQALEAYRASILEAEPGLPENLVAGYTIEELRASRDRAREIVERVRGRLEEQALMERTPSGAPARSDVDVSALSPEEKIRLGLSRR
ncbi:MAG: hypothetical protein OYI31_03135 [Chloroflexota bacterium]|nr:hypothetical protein [Chloroflexota bacterium]MDE2941341.1 hypothetical protein [Chloroflexota bacterium]MDE3267440.1 hypothetical protein [Chloroflexota bacterium]